MAISERPRSHASERQARRLVLMHPRATHAGWLLACAAPSNIAKGQDMIDAMGLEDSEIAIQYRDYCLALYKTI